MVKFCLVGYKGYWSKFLRRAFEGCAEFTTFVDATEVHERLENGKFYSSSMKEALHFNSNNFDAVIIATPPESHYEIAKLAITNKKHVLIEKPMTTNSFDAKHLNALAEKNNVLIGVDHTFLFSNHIRVIKRMIEEGKIGKPLRIVSNRLNLGKFQDSGVVWDLMPHDIAMTNFLMGSLPKIKNVELMNHLDSKVVDTANISMEYGEVSYSLNISWLYPKKVRTTVILGTDGMIDYDMLSENPLKLYDKRATKGNTAWEHSFNWVSEFHGECKEPLQILALEFCDYISGKSNFISDGVVGQNVVECIEETLKSK